MKEVQCPTCGNKEITMVRRDTKGTDHKYLYLCRTCKESFYVKTYVTRTKE